MGKVLEEPRVGLGRVPGYIGDREGHGVTCSMGAGLGVPVEETEVLGSQSARCW